MRPRSTSLVQKIALQVPEQPHIQFETASILSKLDSLSKVAAVEWDTLETSSPEDGHVKRYRDQMQEMFTQYEAVIAQLNTVIESLDHIRTRHRNISKQLDTFQTESNELLSQKQQLAQLNHDLLNFLDIFKSLDLITRRLHSPGSSIVVKESFIQMLGRIDECLKFVRDTPFKDSDLYQVRFKQCLVRSMSLIRNYTVMHFRAENYGEKDALAYNKFQQNAQLLRPLILELFKRREPEVVAMLDEVFRSYMSCRLAIVRVPNPDSGDTTTDTTGTERRKSSTCSIDSVFTNKIQEAIDDISLLSEAETRLFHEFFPREYRSDELVSSLCEPIYDSIRSRIIKERDISQLCDACTLNLPAVVRQDLQERMVLLVELSLQSELKKSRVFTSNVVYKPLIKACRLLGQIYERIEPSVFNDLMHQTVRDCCDTLTTDGSVDSLLWYMKNVTYLETQIQQFEIGAPMEIVDIKELIMSEPTTYDARQELPRLLSSTGAKIIEKIVHEYTSSLASDSVTTCLQSVSSLRDKCDELKHMQAHVATYLDTSQELMDGVKNGIVQRYSEWYDALNVSTAADREVMSQLMQVDELSRLLFV